MAQAGDDTVTAVARTYRIPAISWRAGIDLNLLDVTRADDVRWLSCLAAMAALTQEPRR